MRIRCRRNCPGIDVRRTRVLVVGDVRRWFCPGAVDLTVTCIGTNAADNRCLLVRSNCRRNRNGTKKSLTSALVRKFRSTDPRFEAGSACDFVKNFGIGRVREGPGINHWSRLRWCVSCVLAVSGLCHRFRRGATTTPAVCVNNRVMDTWRALASYRDAREFESCMCTCPWVGRFVRPKSIMYGRRWEFCPSFHKRPHIRSVRV